MKSDKILFGGVCLIMAYMCNAVYNKTTPEVLEPATKTTLLGDSVRLKPILNKDTLHIGNVVKSDTLKCLKIK